MIGLGRKEKGGLVAVALLLLAGLVGAAQPANSQFKCFPSCGSTDARLSLIHI